MAKQRPGRAPKRAGAKKATKPTGPIYSVKITLARVAPPIWRRVEVPDCSLAMLHVVIQVAMGWEDAHLHVFRIREQEFGLPEQWEGGWDENDVGDSEGVKLSDLVAQRVKKFKYEYDMGDSWEHVIQIEKTLEPEPKVKYPRCVAGARACPPEDCGGPWGYQDLQEALADPKHARNADEMMEWFEDFDPEAFSLEEVNKYLTKLR